MEFSGKNPGVGCCALLPDPGIKPVSLVSPALAGEFLTDSAPGKPISDDGEIIPKK